MKAIFMGTPQFAVNSLDTLISKGVDVGLVITRTDKKQGRNMKIEMPPVKKRALELGLEVYQPEDIKSQEAIDKIRQINPDIIIVTAYGEILPTEILNMPKYGCINVHASLLPKYRGASPINTCLLNGDNITGITTMYMNEELDSGDIILKDELEISLDDDYVSLTEKLAKLSEKTLGNIINMLNMSMDLPRLQQNHQNATYCTLITKEMGHIDYSKSADEIINTIRGLNSFSIYNDTNFKIFKAKKLEDKSSDKVGMIVKCDENELVVTTATKDISLLQVQMAGKKKMMIEDFLRGNKLEKGVIFK
ncbi:methionyl-tRNA formyltransferase [Peptoanaerobacter stomatis]|uniref:Methionyl-tRNA formyltransferase n=1 Tax=Peptoanaerobacter stomatis TaxID=796937 RepID=J5W7R8_9FIRM|nr:methionyl-tRNA formyltransferase [Peptoanaerobacter stomatis]EJU19977.1 methionyl-tRNA formyltransferase [Peptoanaerobacter stomatis]